MGVVFVKLAQTLATREDLVGAEAAAALGVLQDANTPFDDAVAMRMIREDLAWPGPLTSPSGGGSDGSAAGALGGDTEARRAAGGPLFANLGASPLAAASLAQVYQATTLCGAKVAVKVRQKSPSR